MSDTFDAIVIGMGPAEITTLTRRDAAAVADHLQRQRTPPEQRDHVSPQRTRGRDAVHQDRGPAPALEPACGHAVDTELCSIY